MGQGSITVRAPYFLLFSQPDLNRLSRLDFEKKNLKLKSAISNACLQVFIDFTRILHVHGEQSIRRDSLHPELFNYAQNTVTFIFYVSAPEVHRTLYSTLKNSVLRDILKNYIRG